MTDTATISRRYPWTDYARGVGVGPEALKTPFRVSWIVPDNTPGLYGWRSEIRCFATEVEGRAVAERSMGIARDVRLERMVLTDDGKRIVRWDTLYTRKNAALAKRRAK